MTHLAPPLVTLIVPVFNVAAYLPRCVESLLAQTHPHLEIILIDDGSTDGGGELCDTYASRDPRVRVVHQDNSGLSQARNAGLARARGDFISFVDGDDWIDRRFVERLLRLAEAHSAHVVACHFARTDGDWWPEPVSPTRESVRTVTPGEALSAHFGPEHTVWAIACAKLFAAELWAGVTFPIGRLHEDEFTTYRVVHSARAAVVTSAALYYYRQRASSITGAATSLASRRDALSAAREQRDYVADVDRIDLLPVANATLFRKQLALHRALGPEQSAEAHDVWQQMRGTADDLRRGRGGGVFPRFAKAYVTSPGAVGAAYRLYERLSPLVRSTLARPARRKRQLRVLVSSGWLGGAGGAERALHSVLAALAQDQVEVVVRRHLDGPLAVAPAGIRIRTYEHWRWWAAGHRSGFKGAAIQRVVNPVRRWAFAPYDVLLRSLSGPGLEGAARARVTLVVPSGNEVDPAVGARYDYVALQAPDNVRLVPTGARATLLPPPVLALPPPQAPGVALPEQYLLTVFNPYDPVKGMAQLQTLVERAPLPTIWCHSTRTLDFDIPEVLRDHPRIVHVDDPTQSELHYLYVHCSAYVSLSRSEGFGWSIADALRYSPAIVSREIGVLTFPEARDERVHVVEDFAAVDWPTVLHHPGPVAERELDWLSPAAFRERLVQLARGGS